MRSAVAYALIAGPVAVLTAALTGGLGAAACGEEAPLVLPPPDVPGARSMLVAMSDEAGLEVIASAALEPVRLRPKAQPITARIELAYYDRSLDELGLEPGVLSAASVDEGTRLPAAQRHYIADVAGGAPTAWLPRLEPSPPLRDFRYRPTGLTGCRTLEVEVVLIPGTVDFVLTIDTEGRTIVYGGDAGLHVMVGHDVRPLAADLPAGFRPTAGGTTRFGDLVLISDDGRVGSALLEGDVLRVREAFAGSRTASAARYLDGGRLHDGPEIYTLSKGGEVSHVFPTGVRIDDKFDALPPDVEFGGVVRMRSGSALVGASSSTTLWFTDRARPARTGIEGGVTALSLVEGFGVLVGTGSGLILAESLGFEPLGPTGSAFPITGIAPFGDAGFIYGGAQGTVGYYEPEVGFCFDERTNSELVPIWIIRRSDEWVVLGQKLVSQSARAAFVTVGR